jgi:hypothetical protein
MPRERHSELYEEVCEMYLVATVTLVTALMALLILGFLRVARELLSRSIYETPSCQDEGNFEQVERESGHWMPVMVEYSGEPNTCSNPEAPEDDADSLSSDNVRKQPPFGRGIFGATGVKPNQKTP